MHGKGARVDLHRDKAYIYTKKKEKKNFTQNRSKIRLAYQLQHA